MDYEHVITYEDLEGPAMIKAAVLVVSLLVILFLIFILCCVWEYYCPLVSDRLVRGTPHWHA